MITLSASSIRDFLICPARYYFRTTYSDISTKTPEMITGDIVHSVIEAFPSTKAEGLKLAIEKYHQYNKMANAYLGQITKCLGFYYDVFSQVNPITENDVVEKFFRVKYSDKVTIVGKMDRISDDTIYDWKTSNKPSPKDVSSDIQFIIYYDSFRRLYGRNPKAAYYVSLYDGKLIPYRHNEVKSDILYNEIIPHIITQITHSQFLKKGLFDKFACKYCSYSEYCLQDIGN